METTCDKCKAPILPGVPAMCPGCVQRIVAVAEKALAGCQEMAKENRRLRDEVSQLRLLLAVEMEKSDEPERAEALRQWAPGVTE